MKPNYMFRKDGFGDTAFLLKYRFYASNEKNKSAMITAFLGGSVPTGSYSNGRVQCFGHANPHREQGFWAL
jgi:hypothetical protein